MLDRRYDRVLVARFGAQCADLGVEPGQVWRSMAKSDGVHVTKSRPACSRLCAKAGVV